MDFSFLILASVVLVNTLYMMFMFHLEHIDESLPARGSLIPGTRQKFLYVEDFHSCTWGDAFGLPLIINAFVHLVIAGCISNGQSLQQQAQWAVFVAIAIADGIGFLLLCLRSNHKPDQGYPSAGKASWHGLSHLPYHGVGVAMSVLAIWHIFAGNLRGPVLYVALVGGAIYIASFIADIHSGNFDPLKLEPVPGENPEEDATGCDGQEE